MGQVAADQVRNLVSASQRFEVWVMPDFVASSDGARARIGLVVPSINTVMEAWAARVLPEGVSLHTSRMMLANALTPDGIREMDRTDGMRAIRQVASCRPAVIAYGCTASSIVQGISYDAHLRGEIEHVLGGRATTAAHAIVTGLHALGARTIAVVSPYTSEVDAAEHRYFESAGFEVVGGACLGITDNFRLAEPTPDVLYKLGCDGWDARADALVISCLNTRSHTVIEALESHIGRPVVTSTQATLWHAMRLAGVDDAIPNAGRLLRG
jgi:maleate isomerase